MKLDLTALWFVIYIYIKKPEQRAGAPRKRSCTPERSPQMHIHYVSLTTMKWQRGNSCQGTERQAFARLRLFAAPPVQSKRSALAAAPPSSTTVTQTPSAAPHH